MSLLGVEDDDAAPRGHASIAGSKPAEKVCSAPFALRDVRREPSMTFPLNRG